MRPGPDPLCQLPAPAVAHIARRGPQEPGRRVLLGVLGHIQADHGGLAAVDLPGQGLAEGGLPHPRGPRQQEGRGGPSRLPQAQPAPADGGGRGADGLGLAQDRGPQLLLQVPQGGPVPLPEAAQGDARGPLEGPGHGLPVHDPGPPEAHRRGALVQQVHSLIREKAAREVAVAEPHRGLHGLGENADPVVLFQAGRQGL